MNLGEQLRRSVANLNRVESGMGRRRIESVSATTIRYYWGKDLSGPLRDFFRHRFSTKYFDPETGLYYYGYRFYCTWLMRWITRNLLEEKGGINRYCFCDNEAIRSYDSIGLSAFCN